MSTPLAQLSRATWSTAASSFGYTPSLGGGETLFPALCTTHTFTHTHTHAHTLSLAVCFVLLDLIALPLVSFLFPFSLPCFDFLFGKGLFIRPLGFQPTIRAKQVTPPHAQKKNQKKQTKKKKSVVCPFVWLSSLPVSCTPPTPHQGASGEAPSSKTRDRSPGSSLTPPNVTSERRGG